MSCMPGIMPYFLTGALTATGNAWNTTIVAEAVSLGKLRKSQAYGIGAYIADMTDKGDYAAHPAGHRGHVQPMC